MNKFIQIIKKFNFKLILITIPIILLFSSCSNENSITSALKTSAKNLVIVSDNEEGSYMMIRILGQVRTEFPDINITFLKSKLFDVIEGSFMLNTALKSFPAGTVFVGIIEPGANSKRIVFKAGSQLILAPDNSLSTWILEENPGVKMYYIENPIVLNQHQPSELTFEDFYAYSICSLISGKSLTDFGTECTNPNTFTIQEPSLNGNTILGQIIFTDNFGNCITNIPKSLIANLPLGTNFTFETDSANIPIKLGVTYSSVPIGDNVCLINSSQLLELAINYGNFSLKYSQKAGSIIKITF